MTNQKIFHRDWCCIHFSSSVCGVPYIMDATVCDTGNVPRWHMLHTSEPQCVHYFPQAQRRSPPHKPMRCQRTSLGDFYCPIVLVKFTHDVFSIQQAQLSQSQMYTREQHMRGQTYVQQHITSITRQQNKKISLWVRRSVGQPNKSLTITCVNKSPTIIPTLNHMSPIHTSVTYLFIIHINNILPSTLRYRPVHVVITLLTDMLGAD